MITIIKKWFGGVIVLVLILIGTPWILGWKDGDVKNDLLHRDSLNQGGPLLDGLGLTPEQRREIDQIQREYEKKMMEACEQHCSARMKIAGLMQSGKSDFREFLKIEENVSRAYSASETMTIQHVLNVSQILTADQRKIFLKRYGDRIEASCPLEFIK